MKQFCRRDAGAKDGHCHKRKGAAEARAASQVRDDLVEELIEREKRGGKRLAHHQRQVWARVLVLLVPLFSPPPQRRRRPRKAAHSAS